MSAGSICRILLIVCVAISGLGCEATIQIDGKVTDLQAKPVAGAALEFSSKSGPRFNTLSGDDGTYSARFTTPTTELNYTLTAKKPGFEDFRATVDYTIEHRDVVMMPKGADH
jgi:hypothetical protein